VAGLSHGMGAGVIGVYGDDALWRLLGWSRWLWGLAYIGGFIFCAALLLRRAGRARRLLDRLARRDPSWDAAGLEKFAADAVMGLYDALVRQDLDALHRLLHPDLWSEWEARVADLRRRGVTAAVRWYDREVPLTVTVVGVENFREDELDSWTAVVWGKIAYYEVDRSGDMVPGSFQEKVPVPDMWRFEREGDRWVVRAIWQSGGGVGAISAVASQRVRDEESAPDREGGGS